MNKQETITYIVQLFKLEHLSNEDQLHAVEKIFETASSHVLQECYRNLSDDDQIAFDEHLESLKEKTEEEQANGIREFFVAKSTAFDDIFLAFIQELAKKKEDFNK
jgi:hypothetical protein